VKSCFGTIYPDLQQFELGKPLAGKVFRITVASQGPGHRDRQLHTDIIAWQDCQQCSDFRNCYDFSNSKLEMQRVLVEL
jgi:hypothetical protein